MTKIILYLSGAWDEAINNRIEDHDILLYAQGLKAPKGKWKTLEIPKIPTGRESEIARWMLNETSCNYTPEIQSLLECYINDYYSYVIRPLTAAILYINNLARENGVDQLLVISARSESNRFPVTGFQTPESRRGSSTLLMSRLARQLPRLYPNLHVTFAYNNGDLFSREWARIAGLRLANAIFLIAFILRVTWLRFLLRSRIEHPKPGGNLLVVRTLHQIRFASNLGKSNSNFSIVLFPQLTQGVGNLIGDFQKMIDGGIPVVLPSIACHISAIRRTYKEIGAIKRVNALRDSAPLIIDGIAMPFSMGDVEHDVRLMSLPVFYKNLLARIMKRTASKKIVNFELVGNIAGLEAMAARETETELNTVQTALVSAVIHPVFPLSKVFLCDGPHTRKLIQNIGVKRYGEVVFAGPPFRTYATRKCAKISRIAFFTQPYESSITIEIIEEICTWARESDAKIFLRLHPRDKLSIYAPLVERHSGTLIADFNPDISVVINGVDLSITRTSSVAKESLALGCPILLCLWSDFDRMINADYVVRELGKEYISFARNDIRALLDNSSRLSGVAEDISSKIFEGKSVDDLAGHILS
ncbi:MAG: hypothetical protein JNK28_02970 [Burkholderiaceae bacterium]|nr:hypothetical protein [Burkholderiaceae bacterium]